MDLTPQDIQEKRFHDSFRGYSHEEVDLFLDEVSESFERVFRENQRLHHRLRELEGQLGQAREIEEMLKRMLVVAQRTADETVEEARRLAESLVSEATARAEETELAGRKKIEEAILAAEEEAANRVVAAEMKARQIVEEAAGQEREILQRIEGLTKFEGDYRERLHSYIESIESHLKPLYPGAEAVTSPPSTRETAPPEPPPQSAAVPVEAKREDEDFPGLRALEESLESENELAVMSEDDPAELVPEPSRKEEEEEGAVREMFWGEE